jgi:hypothetical protein
MNIQAIEKGLTICAAVAAIVSATIMCTQAINTSANAQPTLIQPCVVSR